MSFSSNYKNFFYIYKFSIIISYRGCNNEYFDGIFAVELLVVLLFDDDEIDIDCNWKFVVVVVVGVCGGGSFTVEDDADDDADVDRINGL